MGIEGRHSFPKVSIISYSKQILRVGNMGHKYLGLFFAFFESDWRKGECLRLGFL